MSHSRRMQEPSEWRDGAAPAAVALTKAQAWMDDCRRRAATGVLRSDGSSGAMKEAVLHGARDERAMSIQIRSERVFTGARGVSS